MKKFSIALAIALLAGCSSMGGTSGYGGMSSRTGSDMSSGSPGNSYANPPTNSGGAIYTPSYLYFG